jgi:hypothetical protein
MQEGKPFNHIWWDALLTLLLNFVSEYAIRRMQESHEEVKLARIPFVYDPDVNWLGENINT